MSDPFAFLNAEINKFKESDLRRDQLLLVSLRIVKFYLHRLFTERRTFKFAVFLPEGLESALLLYLESPSERIT
jgi:hypothetical protein